GSSGGGSGGIWSWSTTVPSIFSSNRYGMGGSGPRIWSPWGGSYQYTDEQGRLHYSGEWLDLYSFEGARLAANKLGVDSRVEIDWGSLAQGDTWDAINSKFGPSFRKDYLPQLLGADRDASSRQSVVDKIMELSDVNLTDSEGNTMRPVQYQITYGLKSNWSDSNKYGLVDGTTTTGNILNPAYWSNDPIWGNPGRLTSTGSANPVGLGFSLPNGDTGFWYVTVYFQKSYSN
ncbi:MAG: hypothetical protein ACKPIC_13895, partial [Microcystis panniformis]